MLSMVLITGALHAEKFDPNTFIPATLAPATFDPAKYEEYMIQSSESLNKNYEQNLKLCKIFAEKSKQYNLIDRNDTANRTKVINCQARIKRYCGALQEAKIED